MIVSGLACLVLGEGLLGRATLRRQILGTLFGTIAFRLLVALALVAGLPADALKLSTAAFVLVALVVPGVVSRARRRLERAGARPCRSSRSYAAVIRGISPSTGTSNSLCSARLS